MANGFFVLPFLTFYPTKISGTYVNVSEVFFSLISDPLSPPNLLTLLFMLTPQQFWLCAAYPCFPVLLCLGKKKHFTVLNSMFFGFLHTGGTPALNTDVISIFITRQPFPCETFPFGGNVSQRLHSFSQSLCCILRNADQ